MFKNNVVNCVREHLDKWYATGNHQETAIQLVDEYEERIMADERRKFAEWCKKNNVQCRKKLDGEWIQFSVSDIVADYEKEQK